MSFRLVPTYIREIFNTTPKQYNLRKADFNIPRFRTVHYGKHSLRYFGSHLPNKLDKNDREKPNVNSFINSIKSKDLSYLIDNCKNCDTCCEATLNSTFFIYLRSFKILPS